MIVLEAFWGDARCFPSYEPLWRQTAPQQSGRPVRCNSLTLLQYNTYLGG